jgi:hypothetical protein
MGTFPFEVAYEVGDVFGIMDDEEHVEVVSHEGVADNGDRMQILGTGEYAAYDEAGEFVWYEGEAFFNTGAYLDEGASDEEFRVSWHWCLCSML